jgi:hypothetical protein
MQLSTGASVAVILAGIMTSACDNATAPTARQPVQIRASVARSQASPPTGGDLEFSSFKVALGAAALGSGEEFGCKDCQDEGPDGAETTGVAHVAQIPVNGGVVVLQTEQVQPGTYNAVELELKPLTGTAPAGWTSGTTIQVIGTYRGRPFTASFAVQGELRQQLTQPVTIANAPASSISVTMTLPVSTWFSAANGTALDPNDAAQRAQIEANVRAAVQNELESKAETERR